MMATDEKRKLTAALADCGKVLLQIAEALSKEEETAKEKEKPGIPAEVEAPPEKKTLALEDVRAVLASKSRDGFTAEVRELLKKHGAGKLSDVPPAGYEALLAEAEVLSHAG